jgi:hypothetical protein
VTAVGAETTTLRDELRLEITPGEERERPPHAPEPREPGNPDLDPDVDPDLDPDRDPNVNPDLPERETPEEAPAEEA